MRFNPEWKNSADGFIQFVDDVKPMMRKSDGEGFEPLVLTDFQKNEIRNAMQDHIRMIVWCWPRRHSKTLINSAIIYWRFLCFNTQNIGIVANSVNQSIDTAFQYVADMVELTPFSKQLVAAGRIRVNRDEIVFKDHHNKIKGYPHKASVLYGKKLTIAQVSELHAFADESVFSTVTGNTVDTQGALVLVDSTASDKGNLLYKLYEISERGDDPALYFSYISYENERELLEKSPPWITRAGLATQKNLLQLEFEKEFLNKWTSGLYSFFSDEMLVESLDDYGDLDSIVNGRAYVVGAGLDRARSVSLTSDNTVLTFVVKVTIEEDDHYFVLASDRISKLMTAKKIQQRLQQAHKEWNLKYTILEDHEVTDLYAWCEGQPWETSIEFPNNRMQNNIFTALQTIASDGRLHIHRDMKHLISEMRTFEYEFTKSGLIRFEGAKGTHDDHVYSLAWAIRSVNAHQLNPYEINGVYCNQVGPVAQMCILNGGEIVPLCSSECRSMHNVIALHDRYKANKQLFPLKIEEFYKNKVVNIGSHVSKR